MFRLLRPLCYELLNTSDPGAVPRRFTAMTQARLVLVHGIATTSAIWSRLTPLLEGYDVCAPDRPRSGTLETELAWLGPLARESWVVGMSGGATLGLALACTAVPLKGAVLHEPAVGSLAPGLLDHVAAAFAAGGTAALAAALYGPSWTPDMDSEPDDDVTSRELAMFRGFEPGSLSTVSGQVMITYGGSSPAARRHAAHRLGEALGCQVREIPCARHFAAHDAPSSLAHVLREHVG